MLVIFVVEIIEEGTCESFALRNVILIREKSGKSPEQTAHLRNRGSVKFL